MNVYDLLNLGNVDKEQGIKDAISEVKEALKDLNTDATCKIYSGYITDALRRKHILNRIITTDDFGCSYSHQFNLVPKDEKTYYLIDLTYEQFHREEFPNLKENGYMIVEDDSFRTYLEITGATSVNITLKDAFSTETGKVR